MPTFADIMRALAVMNPQPISPQAAAPVNTTAGGWPVAAPAGQPAAAPPRPVPMPNQMPNVPMAPATGNIPWTAAPQTSAQKAVADQYRLGALLQSLGIR